MPRIELSPLSEIEMRETVLKSLEGTGVSISLDVVNRVFEYTGGHQFEMQVLCYHLFNNQLSRRIDLEVWDKALQAALEDLGVAIFDYWFSQASGEEAKVLHAIAQTDPPISAERIYRWAEARQVQVSPRNIAKYLQRLLEKNLVCKSSRGFYTIQDRMFCAYICTRPG